MSSNDLLADRRFAWAMALLDEGDVVGAADLLDQVVDVVPRWASGWSALGDARERLGEREAALSAWRHAEALDPDGRLGASLKIARLEGRLSEMPPAYVASLFDDYAPRFERHLVETLRYRAPALLAAALEETDPGRRFDHGLDLGCGTGLMGRALSGRVAALDGVDLSPAMVTRARATGLYARLVVGSITAMLAETGDATYDLVTAADVLVYVGDLAPLAAAVSRVLAPGGVFGFTAQVHPGPEAFALGDDLRFSHARSHVEGSVGAAGQALLRLDAVSTRSEKGRPVPGFLAVARRR